MSNPSAQRIFCLDCGLEHLSEESARQCQHAPDYQKLFAVAEQLLREGILAMTRRGVLAWADRVRAFLRTTPAGLLPHQVSGNRLDAAARDTPKASR